MGMITLRSHHLLCTQAYSGKGYDEEFVEYMDRLVKVLRGEEAVQVRIRFSTDGLCEHCPNKKGEGLCKTEDKVKRYDRKVADYFHLEEKEYVYQEITAKIRREMTPEMLEDICQGCSWYPVSACRKILTERI